MHDNGHTHQVKHRTLRMQVCSEHRHWAHAQLVHLHTRRLDGVNRKLVPGECTQLCCRAELPGSWHRHRIETIWDLLKSKKALAHHRALAVTTNHGTSLIMDCQYGLCSLSLTSFKRPQAQRHYFGLVTGLFPSFCSDAHQRRI
jgi:hypothetical protein